MKTTGSAEFRAQIEAVMAEWAEERRQIVNGVAEEIEKGIKDGSAVTGAPGQPVDTGYLRNSWQRWYEDGAWHIATNCAYAPAIEHDNRAAAKSGGAVAPEPDILGHPVNVGRGGIKSTVGGNHSVKLVVSNFDRIVATVVREVTGAS